jgi:hypothetical protein
MKPSEQFALDEWLFEYPKNTPFDDILYLTMDDNDSSIIPWGVADSMPRRELAQCISNTQTHFATFTNEDRKPCFFDEMLGNPLQNLNKLTIRG